MKKDNIEFARLLSKVQDELGTLCSYLEHDSVIGEREVSLSFNESIRAITRLL